MGLRKQLLAEGEPDLSEHTSRVVSGLKFLWESKAVGESILEFSTD